MTSRGGPLPHRQGRLSSPSVDSGNCVATCSTYEAVALESMPGGTCVRVRVRIKVRVKYARGNRQ